MTITHTKEGKVFTSSEQADLSKFDKYTSFGHYLLETLGNHDSDLVILVDDASGRRWTSSELMNKILNVATALIDNYNFQQGTFACISYEHSDISFIVALAIVCAGGVVASAFPSDPYNELLYLARKVEPKFLFCASKNLNWTKRLNEDLGIEVVGIVMGELVSGIDETIENGDLKGFEHIQHLLSYDSLQSKSLNQVPVACKEGVGRDLAFVMMSSGTTGLPKAVPATHRNCLVEIGGLVRSDKGVRVASIAPLDYVSGRLILNGAIGAGYTAIILRSSEPKSFLAGIQKHKINVIYMGAASFYNLITSEHIDSYDLSSLVMIFPMGAKILFIKELSEFLAKHPNIVQIIQGYGASEFGAGAIRKMRPDVYLKDCDNCGTLEPGVQVKVVDLISGELLGKNEKGALRLKNNSLFPGYYDIQLAKQAGGKQQQQEPLICDANTFDQDGFYITGDIGYFNEHEQLYIVGRHKELMNCRNGKKVVPQELEEMLGQHPAVDSVCVLGFPNKLEPSIHCPRAFVVPKPDYFAQLHIINDEISDSEINHNDHHHHDEEVLKFTGNHTLCSLSVGNRRKLSEDIVMFLNARISWEKQLTGGLVILDQIPTLRATGKMDKGYLRSLALDRIEIYADQSG